MARTAIDRDILELTERFAESGAEGKPRTTLRNYACYVRRFSAWLKERDLGLEDVDAEVVKAHVGGTHGQRPAVTAIRTFYRWMDAEGILPGADARVGPKGGRVRLGGFLSEADELLIEQYELHRRSEGKRSRPRYEAIRSLLGYLNGRGVTIGEADTVEFLCWCNLIRARYAPRTADGMIGSARVFCEWLHSEGISGKIVPDDSRRKPRKRTKSEPLPIEEARMVLEAAQHIGRNEEARLRNVALVSLVLLAAVQPVEIHRANVGDVAFLDGHAALLVRGVGGRPDTMAYIPSAAARTLQSYLTLRGPAPTEPLFTSLLIRDNGSRLKKKSIYNTVKKAFDSAGVDGSCASHRLKQTALDLAERSGASGARLAEIARVRHPKSRIEREVKLDDDTVRERIAELLRSCDEGSAHSVASADELRAVLDDIDSKYVDVTIRHDGSLKLNALDIPGDYER